MNYPLENLDPERFQHFCQALLVREHPQLQCFPVAQPDGGRDAISYISEQQNSKFIVFQVKFSRKPLSEPDPQKWLLAIMSEEAPKLARLIPHGASQFYLLTNIDGTAHLDIGSIDRLNRMLSEQMGVPFMCWWRDDLNRRLDNAWDLKWAYPDLMTGPDFLRCILESGLREDRDRRESALRAFLAQQLKADEQVRFRQVELQNSLLDLFIDVPIGLRDQRTERRQAKLFYGIAHGLAKAGIIEPDEYDFASLESEYDYRVFLHPESSIGATALLLSREFQGRMPHVVLEGAPGQGKSTIAQYVCQVHRLKVLNDSESLSKIPARFRPDSSARLPIKIDLRDFATWLGKKDPFDTDETKLVPPSWRKTLESFIAALVSFQSGGTNFSTDDFLAIVKVSSVLLIFDGLDEVADIGRRQEVVEEIVKGVQRLEANAASLQTIVTSRPAAFANSPGMPADKYPYLQLLSLTRPLINEYAERWLRARNVDPREAAAFRKALKEKLDQPHLRDLARNPMQLAILLSLILTRGTSLPDKRTALYDNYIDLFFSRESEKSRIVRDHRELLIDIHRYLAWLLQSESEKGNSRGSISQDRLQQTLAAYLSREGQDARLATELFTGMVERVVALVSRVEGTFEFEVQPLREYFAARFLYDTAPYSPPGRERGGTKPDRFDALSRNFYWTNVTRFYSGCFSKGELPALVERLQELAAEAGFRYTSHPRMLAATLLSDWVFTQNPRSVKQVVEVLLDGIGLRYLLASGAYGRRRRGLWNPLALPPRCGSEEVVARCFDLLGQTTAPDYAQELIEVAKANAASIDELIQLWSSHFEKYCAKAHTWLGYGVELGILSRIDTDRLKNLLQNANIELWPIGPLYRSRRLDIIECTEGDFQSAVDGILDRQLLAHPQRRIESALDALAHSLDAHRYTLAFSERAPVPLVSLVERRGRPTSLKWSNEFATNTEAYSDHKKCVSMAELAQDICQKSAAEWASEIGPWDRLVELGRTTWGDRWVFSYIANIAAGIRSNAERCKEYADLLDCSKSLCRRARHARLKSGNKAWWKEQFGNARSAQDQEFLCLVALTWATPATLILVHEELERSLTSLDQRSWYRVARAVHRNLRTLQVHKSERLAAFDPTPIMSSTSTRTVAALMMRADAETAHALYRKRLRGTFMDDEIVLEQIQTEALDLERFGTAEWSPDLATVKQCYLLGTLEPHIPVHKLRNERYAMPLAIAEAIAEQPTMFPGSLLGLAEEALRRDVAGRAEPVTDIAERQGWFEQPSRRTLFD